jgi:hypothetical protein
MGAGTREGRRKKKECGREAAGQEWVHKEKAVKKKRFKIFELDNFTYLCLPKKRAEDQCDRRGSSQKYRPE